MIDEQSSLGDVCFTVAAALADHGIAAVLTGGSAASIYVPLAYGSLDADFVLRIDEPLERIAAALADTGFVRSGRSRMFVHARSKFTVDFPKGPLAVGGDYVRDVASVERDGTSMSILTPTDCVRDRLAHYYFWDDMTALEAAVAVARSGQVDHDVLRDWTNRESPALLEKLAEFERRAGLLS